MPVSTIYCLFGKFLAEFDGFIGYMFPRVSLIKHIYRIQYLYIYIIG